MLDLLVPRGRGARRLKSPLAAIACALAVACFVLTGATRQAEANKGLGGLAVGLAAGMVIGGAMANANKNRPPPQQQAKPRSKPKTYSKPKPRSKPKTYAKPRPRPSTPSRSVAQSAPKIDTETYELKSALAMLGHLKGKVDDDKDADFDVAVRSYQTSKKLASTGVLDSTQKQLLLKEADGREQLISMGAADAPLIGEEGDKRMQVALQVLGFYEGAIDGDIGPKSRRAISAYQAENGLDTTGSISGLAQSQPLLAKARQSITANLSAIEAQFAQISRAQFAAVNPGQPVQTVQPQQAAAAPAATAAVPGYLPTPTVQPAALTPTAASFAPIEPVKADAVVRRPTDVAVIIGNRDYKGDIPDVAFGHRDADAMKSVLVNELGFSKHNIIDARDAGQAELVSIFGSKTNNRGKVWRMIDPDGTSNVFVFYSGHGAPDTQSNTPYLMPVDSHPDTIELNGYPLSQMYSNLESLEVQSVAVFLDACFSGSSAGGMLTKSASPVAVTAKMPAVQATQKLTVLAAAEGDQLASWNEKAGFGMFTNYLVDGLKGNADADGDKTITASELHEFVHDKVRRAARREFGRIQTPVLMGQADYVVRSE